MLVFENTDCTLNSEVEVLLCVGLKGEARAYFIVPLKLNHRVFQTSSLEGNDRSAPYEEFMLYNTAGFECARHESKISSSIDKSTVCEELFWTSPEALRVSQLEIPHALGTLS